MCDASTLRRHACNVSTAFGRNITKLLLIHGDVRINYSEVILRLAYQRNNQFSSKSISPLRFVITCRREGLGGMSHRWMKALPISYSLFSGMIGTQSVLFSKALSTLLRTTIDGHSQLGSWFFWLVLLLFLCCAYFWVTSLNKVSHASNVYCPLHIICCCLLLTHTTLVPIHQTSIQYQH